ncbi:hypothetical protein JKP88DRAFT_265370 [Tribonema minus]|uniref:Uncharacterized protein n=1 Tax=Tribonema minus TaxID=303371 RepID=A0A835YL08_9STRA|nr:hypothetical protein JKP88DRAFT_265370 [Tribonema minus]
MLTGSYHLDIYAGLRLNDHLELLAEQGGAAIACSAMLMVNCEDGAACAPYRRGNSQVGGEYDCLRLFNEAMRRHNLAREDGGMRKLHAADARMRALSFEHVSRRAPAAAAPLGRSEYTPFKSYTFVNLYDSYQTARSNTSHQAFVRELRMPSDLCLHREQRQQQAEKAFGAPTSLCRHLTGPLPSWLFADKLFTAAATYFTFKSLPQSQKRRVKRVAKALLSSTAPPVEDSARGVYLINRERVCAAITPPGFRSEPGPEVTLMSGARAAGKSTVSRLAFHKQKGVMFVELPAGGEDMESLWLTKVYARCGVQAQAGEDASLVLQTALLQLKHMREQRQHKHAQQLLGAQLAAAVADDPQDLMPVFVTDLTSSINSDQLYQLLLLFKRLGPDASLARFVVVVSAAHTAAGMVTPLGQLRVQVIEVGDLQEDEGKAYVSKALHSWLALRPNVMLTPAEENDIVSDTVASSFLQPLRRRLSAAPTRAQAALPVVSGVAGAEFANAALMSCAHNEPALALHVTTLGGPQTGTYFEYVGMYRWRSGRCVCVRGSKCMRSGSSCGAAVREALTMTLCREDGAL